MEIYYDDVHFIGRDKEIKELKNAINSKNSNILVYGKRKVGKTTLIKKVLQDVDAFPIYCECIKDNEEINVKLIVQKLKFLKLIDESISLVENTFLSLVEYLESLNKKIVLVIDEYPYLFFEENSDYINSVFQNIIDKKYNNITLILSGSQIAMMKKMLNERSPLYGRFSYVLQLKELNYREASQFYSLKSNYDKIAFYSIFGGSPFVNNFINPKLSLKENIINTFLSFHSPINIYLSNFLFTDYRNYIQTNKLLSYLKNGRKTYSEIEQVIDPKKTGNLSKILKPLVDMDLIKYSAPINVKNYKKNGKYEINDNTLRFYYTYVEPYKSLLIDLSPDVFYDLYIKDSIDTFISYRFEDIAREYIISLINSRKLTGVMNVGRYVYNNQIDHINGEFDIALEKGNNVFDIIEVKYLKKPITSQMINKEIFQIKNIKDINVDKIGFFSINGFEKDVPDLDYRIDGNDIF